MVKLVMTNEEIARLVRLALPQAENTPANRARFAASENPFEQAAALRMTYEAALEELSAALPGRILQGFNLTVFTDAQGDSLAACFSGDNVPYASYSPDGQLIEEQVGA